MELPPVIQLDLPATALVLSAVAVAWWAHGRYRDRETRRTSGPVQLALDSALGRIRDFASAQGRFVGTLAEEIRTPLATALIHAELLLLSGSEPATVERYARSLVDDVRHLSGLVESFLQLAGPIEQQDTRRHVPVHVHDVVLAAVSRCRGLADTRGVTIAPTLAEPRDGAAVEVLGDAVLLEAMLENLVRNGVMSSPRDGRVEVLVAQVGDEVHVTVRDSGAAILAEDLDAVFRGFFQWPNLLRPPLASGLSLAIAMRVAEHHHGTISLVNAPEGGCRFEVQLPRWRGAALGKAS